MRSLALALAAAIAVQPMPTMAIFAISWFASGQSLSVEWVMGIAFFSVIIAAAHLFLLGLPVVFILGRMGRLNWFTVVLAGLVIGSLVASVLTWPAGDSSYSSSGGWYGSTRQFIVDGNPTIFGWLRYLEGVAYFGMHGVLGAAAFYFTLRRASHAANAI